MVMVWGWPSARCRYAPPTGCSPRCRAPEAGQALLVCVVQIALASGALLGGEVVDWQGVSSAMLFGGALILSAALVFGLSLRSGAIGAKQC